MADPLPPSLEHPLPAGMRDLLPEEASSRRALARVILERFALFGYALVSPPVFEFADVLERGLGTLDPADVLRFVEPESGEVAALRPDMTPQIARIIATRMRDRPPPYRLAYEGSVLRRKSGRARKHRQIPQVGIELAGAADAEADLELLEVASDALLAAGLARFTIDLADCGIVRALLADASPEVTTAVTLALAKKDEVAVKEHSAGLASRDLLASVVSLHGGRDAIVEAKERLSGSAAERPAKRLLDLFDAAVLRGLGPHLAADAGEVRGFAYYTGTMFHIYAKGPGEAIGAGGRYDDLLARFGYPLPSAGLGLDLDHLAWALRDAGAAAVGPLRVVVVGRGDDPRVSELRARGVAATAMAGEPAALEHARSWGYSFVIGDSLVVVKTGERLPSPFAARGKPADPIAELVRLSRQPSNLRQ